jgi:hypothetical protein
MRSYPNVDAWFARFHPETRAWWGDRPEEDGDWFDALYGPLGSQPQPGEEPRAVVKPGDAERARRRERRGGPLWLG